MKRKYILYGLIGVFLLSAAWYAERTERIVSSEGTIERNQTGEDSREVSLIVNGVGLPENYQYDFTVQEEQLSEEQAEEYFTAAEEELEADFYGDGEDADHVVSDVTPKDSYMDGIVTADWVFDDYSCITAEGVLIPEEIPTEGTVVRAEVTMTCQSYRELYEFSFHIYPQEEGPQDQLIRAIDAAVEEENTKTGSRIFALPAEIQGVKLEWKEPANHLVIKMIFLEIVLVVMMKIAQMENERQLVLRRREQMQSEYSEIVSKLSILMGAGMSLKQAWKQISVKYAEDVKAGIIREKPAYEEMLITLRMIQDGESETSSYRQFGERCETACFYRLSRMLIRNLEKGNQKICSMLQKESEEAFEQRRLDARKKGEEAGTKMLLPLMLMLMIVIAIIMVPAIISFNT